MDSIFVAPQCGKAIILKSIFNKSTWAEQMIELGFVPLVFGHDLAEFRETGSISNGYSQPVYLALGLMPTIRSDEYTSSLAWNEELFPQRELFFECLQPWRWINEQEHEILIEGSNIELNIGDYYRALHHMTSRAHVFRLAKEVPGADNITDISDKHTTSAIAYGKEDITSLVVFYYSEAKNCLAIMPTVGAESWMWQFVQHRS